MAGYSDVLIGLQYGDEGKAKIIDLLANDYEIIARFNGGCNAGHTIEKNGIRLALHQIPSGVFYPNKTLYIGSGCVVNIDKLKEEIKDVEKEGIVLKNRLHISSLASVVQPHHIIIDSLTAGSIGTTKNGIGPCYADRAARISKERLLNIRMGDLLEDEDYYFGKIEENLKATIEQFEIDFDLSKTMATLKDDFNAIKEFVEVDTLFMDKQINMGKNVLFEGAQSFMLDVTKGTIPCVTSSNTQVGAAYVGGDLNPKYHRKTFGVAKVIMSRVGNGPFVSEFGGEKSEKYCMYHKREDESGRDALALLASEDDFEMGIGMRLLSNEYGASTKRPRRTGAFDLVQLNYAVKTNGIDELFLTKCDLLNLYTKTNKQKMPLITKYQLDDQKIDFVPASSRTYYRVQPTIEYRDIFSGDITQLETVEELPRELKEFVKEVEDYANCKVMGIGTGPERNDYLLF